MLDLAQYLPDISTGGRLYQDDMKMTSRWYQDEIQTISKDDICGWGNGLGREKSGS